MFALSRTRPLHLRLPLARVLFTLALGLVGSASRAAPASVPDTIEQRMKACAICHGKLGEGGQKSEYYPRLAGKPPAYLYNQLIGFRDGRRSAPIMNYLVRGLSDAYLMEIAQYYAALQAPPSPALTSDARGAAADLARGEMLALKGDATRDIPACASCHGTSLGGLLPAIPPLLGLYPDYISAQMGAWKNGQRKSPAPDCMSRIAQKLSGEDISAVAAWLGSRPANALKAPLPAGTLKLPMDCGSAPAATPTAAPTGAAK